MNEDINPEKSPLNLAFATGERINILLAASYDAMMKNDYLQWDSSLSGLYLEILGQLNPEDESDFDESYNKLKAKIAEAYKVYIAPESSYKQYEIRVAMYPTLLELSKFLIRKIRDLGLLAPTRSLSDSQLKE